MLKELKKIRKILLNWEEPISKLTIEDLLKATRDWFEHYQGKENPNKMLELYSKLIDEELEETRLASKQWDFVEYLDGVIDYVWVTIWFMHFGEKVARLKWQETAEPEEVNRRIWQTATMILGSTLMDWDLIKLAWLEVAYSNWTKSLELQWEWEKVGKVIKWEKFKKPDLKKVIKFIKNK